MPKFQVDRLVKLTDHTNSSYVGLEGKVIDVIVLGDGPMSGPLAEDGSFAEFGGKRTYYEVEVSLTAEPLHRVPEDFLEAL